MPFRCPQCLTRDSLKITASLEIPPDSQSAEIALQVVECSECSFRGLAVYEEFRRGFLEADDWKHTGYWVSSDSVGSVLQAIKECPDRYNPYCKCLSHTSLGQKNPRGVWRGLVELERGHTFAMRLAI